MGFGGLPAAARRRRCRAQSIHAPHTPPSPPPQLPPRLAATPSNGDKTEDDTRLQEAILGLWFGGGDVESNYRHKWFCAPGSARQRAFDAEVCGSVGVIFLKVGGCYTGRLCDPSVPLPLPKHNSQPTSAPEFMTPPPKNKHPTISTGLCSLRASPPNPRRRRRPCRPVAAQPAGRVGAGRALRSAGTVGRSVSRWWKAATCVYVCRWVGVGD